MTDAERIAEYLNEQECGNPWTVNDVERRIKDPSTQCHDLARLLADVRREEREACASAVQSEIDSAKHRWSESAGCGGNGLAAQVATGQAQALGWALKHIKARGVK